MKRIYVDIDYDSNGKPYAVSSSGDDAGALLGLLMLPLKFIGILAVVIGPFIVWKTLFAESTTWIHVLIYFSVAMSVVVIFRNRYRIRDALIYGAILTGVLFGAGGLIMTYVFGFEGLMTSGVPVGEIIGLPFLGCFYGVIPSLIAGGINTILRR